MIAGPSKGDSLEMRENESAGLLNDSWALSPITLFASAVSLTPEVPGLASKDSRGWEADIGIGAPRTIFLCTLLLIS